MRRFESLYGKTMKTVFWFLSPFKRVIIKTACEVHIYINNQALKILFNDGYEDEFRTFWEYRKYLNGGVVWADQDFRSREHFYNPYNKKGLYGCRTSKELFRIYYNKALDYWKKGNKEKGMFYLGAAIHLIQDSTIPQHASINLLKSHRRYEQWIKKVHDNFSHYTVSRGGIYNKSTYEYIDNNAKKAIYIYRKYYLIQNRVKRFELIGHALFPLAQRTTAGCLVNFYNDCIKKQLYNSVS